MANRGDDEEEKQVEEKVYTWKDLYQFESKQMYSSIGRMTLSNKTSKPMFSFGNSTRKGAAKTYQNKELSKTQFVGKPRVFSCVSPSPRQEFQGPKVLGD